jgi:hypothetical protein
MGLEPTTFCMAKGMGEARRHDALSLAGNDANGAWSWEGGLVVGELLCAVSGDDGFVLGRAECDCASKRVRTWRRDMRRLIPWRLGRRRRSFRMTSI